MRDFVSSYLELDEFGVGRPESAYPVHSIYLDSDDLETHNDFLNGTKNRYKLRLRYYDANVGSPVFMELKARVDNCILKRRCGIRSEAVPLVLSGQLPEMDQLITNEPRHCAALERFIVLMQQIQARPKLHNCYQREAWVSPNDNSVRLTFDRKVYVEPYFKNEATLEMKNPRLIFSPFVVLELKFTTRFPDWFKILVRKFNLMQGSSAKYSGGVTLVGHEQFRPGASQLQAFGETGIVLG
jgi:SPX domain protein involved in polyphosphate accumulation